MIDYEDVTDSEQGLLNIISSAEYRFPDMATSFSSPKILAQNGCI